MMPRLRSNTLVPSFLSVFNIPAASGRFSTERLHRQTLLCAARPRAPASEAHPAMLTTAYLVSARLAGMRVSQTTRS